MERDFAEILLEKVTEQVRKEFAQQAQKPESAPLHLEGWIFEIPLVKIENLSVDSVKRNPYLKVQKPHALTETQAKAADFFKKNGIALSPRFSVQELKKAFKRLLIKLHPDHNQGRSSDYYSLREAFASLTTVVR